MTESPLTVLEKLADKFDNLAILMDQEERKIDQAAFKHHSRESYDLSVGRSSYR